MGIDYGSMREALRKRREEGLARIDSSERLQFLKDYAETLEMQITRMTAQLEAHTLYDVGKIDDITDDIAPSNDNDDYVDAEYYDL